MNIHKNARLTPHSRELLVRRILEGGLPVLAAAEACGVSSRTAYKWLRRFREGGIQALQDRSSRPIQSPNKTSKKVCDRVVELRKERRTYREIKLSLGLGLTTIGRIAANAGINRLSALEPLPPVRRYNHDDPGDMLHLDIKKLARFHKPGHRVTGKPRKDSKGIGYEYVHVAIDDASRISFSTIRPDETSLSARQALMAAVRYYRSLGVRFKRVLTDNGPCYRCKRFDVLCRRLGIVHKRTRPYRPQTNGKAERFIQTALREWAYARSYQNSDERARHLPVWQHHYNWHRPHSSLNYRAPIKSLGLDLNNLVGLHT